MTTSRTTLRATVGLFALAALVALPAAADNVINDDCIIVGSQCIGFDCVNGESFGFDTLRLKENNLRIHFLDTSSTASFPSNDWRIVANDSSNGGANYLAFEDSTAGRQTFRVEAGARRNALYVDDGDEVGFGTSTPVVNLHVVDGNTPTLRLEQDGSDGFTPQTWDVAGNEANFFFRDVTSGSTLFFRAEPGTPANTVYLDSTGNIGFGTTAPSREVHLRRTNAGATTLLVENASGGGQNTQLRLLNDAAGGRQWDLRNNTAGDFLITTNNIAAGAQFTIDETTGNTEIGAATNTANLTVHGDINVASGGTKNFAVVDPDDPSRWIYFSALEGPEAGTYYRGSARLVDGKAVVELPGHFTKMTEAEGLTVQLTSVGGYHQLFVAEKSPAQLLIRDARGADGVEFDFLVQGVRKGHADFQVDRPAPESGS